MSHPVDRILGTAGRKDDTLPERWARDQAEIREAIMTAESCYSTSDRRNDFGALYDFITKELENAGFVIVRVDPHGGGIG